MTSWWPIDYRTRWIYAGQGEQVHQPKNDNSVFDVAITCSVTVRTACSASLVGLNEACTSLAKGECSAAIVGGTSLILKPSTFASMAQQGMLSLDGSCKVFSADADGYARGEAIVALYIKPLHAALRDGNPVRSVIRSSAAGSDGRTPGVTTPSSEAQEMLIRRAYRWAGIPDAGVGKTAYVECHGTGTPVGDPVRGRCCRPGLWQLSVVCKLALSRPTWATVRAPLVSILLSRRSSHWRISLSLLPSRQSRVNRSSVPCRPPGQKAAAIVLVLTPLASAAASTHYPGLSLELPWISNSLWKSG